MKNKIILSVGILSLLSGKLLAIDGAHQGLAVSAVLDGAICVYCHTPHGANTTANGTKPLWNKGTSPTTFSMYGTTIAGSTTAEQPTGQSLACLSCHDGVSAMNAVINAPGSGFRAGYAINSLDTNTYLLNSNAGLTKKIMPWGSYDPLFPNNGASKAIGKDGLSNDHPLSIVYVEGRGSLRPTSAPLTGWIGAQTVKDLLRGPSKDTVQCASCHDPHNDANGLYRRIDNSNGSKLCFGCHDK